MTRSDAAAGFGGAPAGAVFYRCALQVNSHGYSKTFRGAGTQGDPSLYAQAIVDKAASLGISVLAITDHNDASGVPAFKVAAEGRGIHIFPGLELGSSEGVHVLCIYPQDFELGQLNRYLGEFGITGTTPSSDLSPMNLIDILRKVRSQGGIAIAAHATSDQGGLLKVLKGQARINAWKNENLLAIQIPGSITDLPPDLRPIVENKDPSYRRPQAPEEGLAISVVNAKDIAKIEDLEDRAASCWIKMSEVSIEGFRQAFLDPGSRIRLNPEDGSLEAEEHAELVSLGWEGGFLDGENLRFNPNLNVLVGGRGAGKSTVVESIRAVLALDVIGEEARKAHEGIVRSVLRNGTKILLRVRSRRPALREYRIERTIPNPPLVKDEQGLVSNLSPREVIPSIEVFGQHEISELTKSREKLTHLLERFVAADEAQTRRMADLRRDLEKSRRSLIEAGTEVKQVEERLASLPGLEETLERFKEAGLEERLKEQSLLVREERVLASIPERLNGFKECLEGLKRGIPIDRAFVSPKAIEDLPGKAILGRLDDVLASLEVDLGKISLELKAILQSTDARVEAIRAEWETRKKSVQESYEKILRDLQKSRVDGEEFIRLRRQIEDLRPLRERLTALKRIVKEHEGRRKKLLAEWEDSKGETFRRLDRAARRINKSLDNRVQVEVTAAGDREPLFKILREDVGGRLSESIEILRKSTELSLTSLTESCRLGADSVEKTFRLPSTQAERLANAGPEVLMRIEELDLPSTTSIKLNTAASGAPALWQSLEELSTGQKATAVLLLLLLESDAPLIVDQPEDDLDNRFITEGIVPRMRNEKGRRQFIFSTHNANIPVLGDAELVAGLTASGEADERGKARIAPEHSGSIDDQSVRELMEDILEGGKEAFERRRRKYGF